MVGSIPFNPGSMWDRFVEVGWWGTRAGGRGRACACVEGRGASKGDQIPAWHISEAVNGGKEERRSKRWQWW